MAQAAQAAVAAGMDELCLTDHVDTIYWLSLIHIFDDAVVDLQNGDIEGAAAQIVDHDLLGLLLIHTKDAGKIAGLDVKRIINEPTAAALAYGCLLYTSYRGRCYTVSFSP